jgi:dihydrofolate reductase
MRRIIIDSIVSLDGYFAGPKDEIDWFVFCDESQAWSGEILRRAGTVMYGRVTYEGFAAYFPTATDHDPYVTSRLNELPKIVFSRTLQTADWKPSTIVREASLHGIQELKKGEGGDLLVLGSSSLVSFLQEHDLIDEYRIRVQPIVLGTGRPLFAGLHGRHPLKLISAKPFNSGVVALHYERASP